MELQEFFRQNPKVAIAFSGGVDSAFLLHAAVDALGAENVLAVTASSASFPARELSEASELCTSMCSSRQTSIRSNGPRGPPEDPSARNADTAA